MISHRVIAIVVNYNGGRLLSECVRSLLSQSRAFDRILIVDNASSDDSLEAIEAEFQGVDILRQPTNIGFAAANNLAVKADASADYIALVNPDAAPRPDWLAELLKEAERHPDTASFASLTLNTSKPDIIDGAGDAYHASGLVWRQGHGQALSGFRPLETRCFSACAAAALYRRSAWDEVGGIFEPYFCYQEDIDLGFRLRLAGYDCRLVPSAVALHHGSAITGKDSEFALFHGHRNLVWTFFRNMPWPLLLLLLPVHLLAQIYLTLRHGPGNQGRSIGKAFIAAWKALPARWAERKAIQRHRKASSLDLTRAFSWWPSSKR